MSNNGIIYLIQPAELLGTQRYKIGASQYTDLRRVKNGYKNGTKYILIMEHQNSFVIEEQIKKVFNKKFKLIAGKEYFEGNENKMIEEFLRVVNKFKNNEINVDNIFNIDNIDNNIEINNNEEKKYKCKNCGSKFHSLTNYKYHYNHNVCKKNKNYQCEKCKKVFQCKRNLQYHTNLSVCEKHKVIKNINQKYANKPKQEYKPEIKIVPHPKYLLIDDQYKSFIISNNYLNNNKIIKEFIDNNTNLSNFKYIDMIIC